MNKIIIVMDSFKGSMSSLEAGESVKRAAERIYPDSEIKVYPMADGGEGTVEALTFAKGQVEKLTCTVTGPVGTLTQAEYIVYGQGEQRTAVLEMAQAAGLTLVPDDQRNPMKTTTYGVGEMIRDAVERGCRRFIIGIGGSATNDAGIGMLQALGVRFLNESGEEICRGGEGLLQVAKIDRSGLLPVLKECEFQIVCDVINPLTGKDGCSRIFAPQKGADPGMVQTLEKGMEHFADVTESCMRTEEKGGNAEMRMQTENPDGNAERRMQIRETGESTDQTGRMTPGAGAAGGLGYAFQMFLNGHLTRGIDIVLRESGIEEEIVSADLVITGEGRMDEQTLMGKTPAGVAALAKKHNKKVIAFAGCFGEGIERCQKSDLFDACYAVQEKKGKVTPEELTTARAAKALEERVVRALENNPEEKQDKRIFTLSKEKPAKAVLKMGVPVTMGMMFMVVYNIVDTFFVGMLGDDYQLAATNLSYPVMMVMVALSAIVASGAASFISRCMGDGDIAKANHTLTTGIVLIVALSVLIMTAGLVFLDPLVKLMGADDNTFGFTKAYTRVLLIGTFGIMGNYTFGQLLRSEGSVMPSMIGLIAGTLANIVLDPLFIFTFGFGIQGAAIATVLGNGLGVLVFAYYYLSGKTVLRPALSYISVRWEILKEILWVGLPHTLEQFMTTAATIVMNNLAASYGGLAVAAMGVVTKLMSFGTYLYQGMTAGCQPILGFCYGAKDFKRLKAVIRSGIMITTLIEFVVMAVFGVLAPYLVSAFTDTQEVIRMGAQTLRAMMWILPFVGTTSIARNTYSAMGMPVPSFGITIVRQLVLYIPFMVLFNRLWGYAGLIHAQPASELLSMVLAVVMLFHTVDRLHDREEAISA